MYDPQYRGRAGQGTHNVPVQPSGGATGPLPAGVNNSIQDGRHVRCKTSPDRHWLSPDLLMMSSPISIRDFSLSLSESDQAETDFNELWSGFKEMCSAHPARETCDPDHFTRDNRGPKHSCPEGQSEIKVPSVPVEMGLEPHGSWQEKSQECKQLFGVISSHPEHMDSELHFIDEPEEVFSTAKPSVSVTQCRVVKDGSIIQTIGSTQIAHDSTDHPCQLSCNTVNPNTDPVIVRAKTSYISEPKSFASHVFISISQHSITWHSALPDRQSSTPTSMESDKKYASPASGQGFSPIGPGVMSSPESVLSLSADRAVSRDSSHMKQMVLSPDSEIGRASCRERV